jgi:hypothetical protein
MRRFQLIESLEMLDVSDERNEGRMKITFFLPLKGAMQEGAFLYKR